MKSGRGSNKRRCVGILFPEGNGRGNISKQDTGEHSTAAGSNQMTMTLGLLTLAPPLALHLSPFFLCFIPSNL